MDESPSYPKAPLLDASTKSRGENATIRRDQSQALCEREVDRPDFRSVLQARMELDKQEVHAGDA